jgi:hypothetical protein
VSKPRSPRGRAGGPQSGSQRAPIARLVRHRRLRLEPLETRALLTAYTYPYGAMPDDTGEYMLGDVAVNVVLMESDPTLAPYDNNSPSDPIHPGRGSPVENWDAAGIATVKANIEAGLQWWKATLANMFPNAPANILNFHVNYQYADNPVHTGYEPIDRSSNDFLVTDPSKPHGAGGWMYDFLYQTGFGTTGNFSTDIRAFNDFTRQQTNPDGTQNDWAFTIFVVNNANDADKLFAPGGFTQAFSYAGGRFEVVPASRPASTFSHETGHQFWALDEYASAGNYLDQRGYYNTQNLNSWDNPTAGFVQAPTIMSNGTALSDAFDNHTLDPYTMAAVGWQDSDHDGIMDVLDVPFTLSGSGQYDAIAQKYTFSGSSSVNTLPNRNSSGLQDDITINQINVVQYSLDDSGQWLTAPVTLPPRTYQTSLDFSIPIVGSHTLKIRTKDLRTGVTSNEFLGETDAPTEGGGGVGGIVFSDSNANGGWDSGESPIPDVGLEVTDLNDVPIDLQGLIEPDDSTQGQVLNNINSGARLSAVGSNIQSPGDVFARSASGAAPAAGLAFSSNTSFGSASLVWNQSQQLRVDFTTKASTVSLQAYATGGGASYGRLEAYNSANQLIARFTTGALTSSGAAMTVSRPQGDIDHVIAYGHLGTNVVLDTLQWGPGASATSNTFGAYSLDGLPDGTYRVHVSAPAGYFVSTPASGYATIAVSGGQTTGSVNFGIAPIGGHRFHNVANGYNVNNDAGNAVSPIDALMVINYLNAHLGGEGEITPTDNPQAVGYIDVNDDGKCSPIDALGVINYINSHVGAHGEGEAAQAAAVNPPAGAAPESQAGEGEGQVSLPLNAVQYYAQQPLHLLQIVGTDQPCTCAACLGLAARKAPVEVPEVLRSELEEALHSIAADVSQAGPFSVSDL